MSANLSTTKKLAGVVSAFAVLFAGAACTKEVSGTATAAEVEKPTETSEKSSNNSSSKSSSNTGPSSSESGGEAPAKAPDEPFMYENGTTVKIEGATEDNNMSGLLSDEVGRVVSFYIENKSDQALDMSTTALMSDVTCEGNIQYVFSDALNGPEKLPAGQKGDYTLNVALKKADVGKTCTIELPFDTEDYSEVDTATFEMTL